MHTQKNSPSNVAANHTTLFQQAFQLHQQGQLEQAETLYRQIQPAHPHYADALHLSGVIAKQRGDNQTAIDFISQALQLKPDNAAAHSNIALAFQALQRFTEALASYERALAIEPDYAVALFNRGITLQCIGRLEDALNSYNRVLAIEPNNAEAAFNRGIALQELQRPDDALASYDRAIAIQSDYAEAFYNRANVLLGCKRYDEAYNSYQRALHIKPDLDCLFGDWLHTKMIICDWQQFDDTLDTLIHGIENNKALSSPFPVLAASSSIVLQKKVTEIYSAKKFPSAFLLPALPKHHHQKIKLAYFSSDFRQHPVSYLLAELIERHDRSQFEVIAFSFHTADAKDAMRLRLEAAFDQFHDVSRQSDRQIADLARQLEIDIAIDLNGYTDGCRTHIFALRAAPVQVSYLGYLGTMGAEYIDYIIADSTLIPSEQQVHYREKIVYLPHSFQVNDSKLEIADKKFTRVELGLPAQGAVFCCFNNNHKITPTVFDSWMRILQQVDGSVLWLLADNASAAKNLQQAASARGINPERLCFAERAPMADYLARQRVADLFLDTAPYNAGATSSAALWAGLPVLTCIGDTFAGRMGASLLSAVGLPELITHTAEDYEALAIQLATHPEQLAALKQKLAANRVTCPLFDTALFTQHIESAYQLMFDRYQADLAPDHIYVRAHDAPPVDENAFSQALSLHQQGQLATAETLYTTILRARPQHSDALHFFGVLNNQLGNAQRAVELISQSLAINPDNAGAQSNLGLALHELKRFDEAIASYDRALAINPNHADAHFNRGHALRELKRFPEAIACYEQALAIKPDLDFIFGTWLYLKMNLCAWDGFTEHLNTLINHIERGVKTVVPFSLLAMSSSAAIQKQAADIYTQAKHPTATRLPLPEKHAHPKIKIGYFSSDFRQHPVSYLAAELFERHDRSQFEVIAFSFHAADVKDAMRLRSEAAFDQFHDVSQQSDQQIVDLARQLEIDIAIDLNGCTDGCRTGVFALRAAQIQATYLGYSGTMGADYIDYIIADSVLIPAEYQTYYREKVVYLPHSYMVNDTVNRPISDLPMTRAEFGLPEQGMVFCCFNNHYKLTPALFASWMRILQRVSGSVLWLSAGNADIVNNLQHAATAHGVDANRLIFAQRLASSAEHLARHRLADLFLDTAPYNAHTTSSDALWADLPVLTCVGEAAASRVAASLLNAIGLTELITTKPEDYEALAIQLATHPEQLAALKQKLATNRLTYPLFDTPLFTRHIESAYRAMFERYQADLAPEHIYVQANDTPPVDANAFSQALSLHQQGQLTAAENLYTTILHVQPQHSDALHFFGVLNNQQGNAQRAVELISQSLAINPDNAAAHSNLGLALHTLKRFDEAIASYDRALAIKPNAETLSNQGNVLQELARYDAALANYERALAINPHCIDALYNRGIVLQVLHRFTEALSDYQQVLAIQPDYEFLFGTWLHLKMNVCDWHNLDSQLKQLEDGITAGKKISIPFTVLAISDSLALQKKSAEIYTEAQHPSHFLAPALIKHAHSKIRIGYFSGDFGQHPVSYLMAELFERHDRDRFEVVAFAFNSANAKDAMRSRLEAAFNQFIDVSQYTDEQVVRLARDVEIDIAIDLHGYVHGRRPNIFAMRAAPIQVSYLGYLGTMGAPYMDYLLADRTLIPTEHQSYYYEKIAYLPHSFQVNDSTSPIADTVFSRTELGLPEQGFVFCCFNNHYKITPALFDCWMRLLQRVDGSVLWLLGANNGAEANLQQAAIAKGIAANRLVFANRAPMPEYLARHRCADLFLDTQPYNAGATASAALWAGLPVLTYLGNTLSGRMAASLLHAIGLPELIARNLEDYEAQALQLATHPEQLAALKQKLANNRLSYPLFNTELTTQHIESAYQLMFERYQADLAPDHIYVQSHDTPPVDANAFSQALSLHQQGKLAEAETLYTAILHAQPQHSDALHFFGVLKNQQGQAQRAVELITQALEINPVNAAAHSNLGLALHALKRFDQAIASYDRALAIKPNAEAYYNRGNALLAIYRYEETLADYEAALAIKPNYIEALSNRGIVLKNLNRFDDALGNYQLILRIKPDSAEAEHGCGVILQDLKRFDEAITHYDRALALKPDLDFVLGTRLYLKRMICDWQNFDDDFAQFLNSIELGKQAVIPFSLLATVSSAAIQKQAADIYTQAEYPAATRLPLPEKHTHSKIKIGYFSSDFRQHPVSYLLAELIERHDRSQFEVIAFSFHTADAKDAMRLRLEAAFDQFHDVSRQSDRQIADLARQLEIDIAIDLNGYTEGCRTHIFALRAAPVQVSYLGYLGTMGAEYIDYIIADSTLIPSEQQVHYREKIVYLPHSFQVNDSKLEIADKKFTRVELGLPAQGAVFCCFNNNYKITPTVFDSWMRILQQVDGSVLWLLADNASAAKNLQQAASARGINPERLCFAERAPMADYLARQRVADLFLDTAPYNAGATASAALWAGLPVLTCIGDTFAGRMGASLLSAVGLPELITHTAEDYEALAIQLATHPEQLAALKQKLAANRLTCPLFNTALFTQHIESAYQLMFNRYQADLMPDHIYVQTDSVQPQQTHELQTLTDVSSTPDADILYNEGNTLLNRQQFTEAVSCYDAALAIQPNHAEALSNRGIALQYLGRLEQALDSYDRAIAIKPDYIDALYNRGTVLRAVNRFEQALSSYQQVLAINPDYEFLFGTWLYMKMTLCEWDNFAAHQQQLIDRITQGKKAAIPFFAQVISNSPQVQKQAAEIYTQAKYPSQLRLPPLVKHTHPKIKVGYFSADFRQHPVATLTAELFEYCDGERFEIIAFSFHATSQKDAMRLQLETVFDQFIDVSKQSDEQVVQLARQLEIDIAVDLNGFTDGCRPNLFALRVAPVQVSYLGYLGTMGAEYMDYLIADSTLIPSEQQAHYREKIVYLPHSFQVNDSKLAIADKKFTRAELGLPTQGVVFCCFNNNYKITPMVFDSWMRILQQVDGSVLWLLADDASAAKNLQQAASARGINPERLCFAERVPMADYLARQRVADLFLDTAPYNAGATASAALWAGLPLVTCIGNTFAGRMGASLLNAIGLPELITTSTADYETLAIMLATHPKQLDALKRKLAAHRLTHPLFDTALFSQHLEAAYQVMFARAQAGLAPEHIYIAAEPMPVPPPQVNTPPKPAKSPSLFAKIAQAGIGVFTRRRKDSAVETQQPDLLFTQAQANTFAHAQCLQQQRQLAAAEILYNQLLKTQPQHPELLRCVAALEKLRLQVTPQPPTINAEQSVTHFNHAVECQNVNRLQDALDSYERVLAIDPHHVDALINRGNVLEDMNRLNDALASYDRAIAAQPANARAHSNRGNVLQSLQRFDEALLSYDRALSIRPDYAEAFYNRGNTLQACKRPREAIFSYEYALAIKPDFVQALISLGNALHDERQFDEALTRYDRALAIQPDHAEALYNRGNVLHNLNRYSDAIDSYNRALAIKPDDAGARWNSSFCYLILGDFDNGWKNYEWRWQTDDFKKTARHFTAPQWSGDEPLQGKTILLYGEQGLGDTLHFCRYAKQVAALGGRVILEAPKPLLPLLAQLEGVEQLLAQGDPLPTVDFHSPLLSLPLAFKTRLDSIPADIPYLFSNPDKVQHWQTVLGAKNLLRVGVVWSGNAAHKNDYNRSLALSELLPLLTLDCQFISLQKELRDTDKVLLVQQPLLQHYGAQLHDFTDTAALIELMDVIISVDTSVAHLAAAMGKPTWILLADNQDWRWLLNRDDSPWYPSVRLFRQTQRGDWQPVIEQVQHELGYLSGQNTTTFPATIEAAQLSAAFQQAVELHQQGQLEQAEVLYKATLQAQPHHADALHLLGVIAKQRGQAQLAIDLISQALQLNPDNAAAYSNRGLAFQALNRFDDALASYDRALSIQPDYAEALFNRGITLQCLKRLEEAIASYDRALAIQPHHAETLFNRGVALQDLKKLDEALVSYQGALAIQADYAEALIGCGSVFQDRKCFNDALRQYEQALAIKPNMEFRFSNWLYIKMNMCDWENFDKHINTLNEGIAQGKKIAMPFTVLTQSSSAALQKKAASCYIQANNSNTLLLPAIAKHIHSKIKIAYFSTDFGNHPVSYLMAELFERHDRSRFEVIAFSFYVTNHKDDMRLRLEATFDQFIDVSNQSDDYVVQLARELEIDIAVDLNGFTEGCRTNIFAMRAAPIQVSYLGYLGTMGTDYMDYLLADATLVPTEHQAYYNEKIAYLPHSFQVNDSKLVIADRLFTRAELGLPAQGFVFCCFNNNYKITPTVFASWMRILRQVDGSVLWLLEDNDSVAKNLRHEAIARGVNAERIYFAKRLPMPEYLARHRVADLFLDTQPYNAGATASAALWSGLPVLTCLGETFASRMAASLLNAIGLPELITSNLSDYEALAIQLATHSEQFAALKQKLAANRLTYPLFNTKLFTQHIEAAYQAMFDRYQADLAPDHIYVPAQEHTTPFITTTHAEPIEMENSSSYIPALYDIPNQNSTLVIDIESVDALINQGNDLEDNGQFDRALACYDRALSLNPDYARAHSNRGNVLQLLQRFDDALNSYDRALAIRPDYAEAFFNRGNTLQACNRFQEAIASYDCALAIKPEFIDALISRGNALQDCRRFSEALTSYDHALAMQPNHAETLSNRGGALNALKRRDEALASYERAIAIQPNCIKALIGRSDILRDLKRINDAIMSYGQALAIQPDYEFLFGFWLNTKIGICEWENLEQHLNTIAKNIEQGKKIAVPFAVLAMSSSAALQKKAAEIYAQEKHPSHFLLPALKKHTHSKIKIGYFSADFCSHATAYLMIELFERHDRSQFEIIAFSLNAVNHKDEMRLRLEATFDQFIDVSEQSDEQVVRLARELEIDIAVDLKGFTKDYRANIFAMQAAPIQVNYLGYPGTMGADYIDYLLADSLLIPTEYQRYYSEKIAYLPNSYQVNDTHRVIANKLFTRAELELPKQGFVFCCFNNNYKITPAVFAVWMRLLHKIEGSVLWLLEDNAIAANNLRREATARGINADRLIFAKRMALPDHLARHRLANLFLDTLPYNAHTTTSDALWAGLPVLTCMGEAFASRVAASLLNAIGLPELITTNLEDYEALAIQLASHPEQLAAIKQKLADNRLTYPLFDTALFTQHIESAYQMMFERYQAGLAPDHIYVQAGTQPAQTSNMNHAVTVGLEAVETLINQGNDLEDLGRLDEALSHYGKALAINPDYARAHSNRGNVLQLLQRFDDALASYDRALAIRPDYAEAFFNRGNALRALNRFDEALSSYDDALAIKPEFVMALVARGGVLQDLKRFADALDCYDRALVMQPDYAEAHYNRGNVLQELKHFEDALAAYDSALNINPEYVEALGNRGSVLQTFKRFDDALDSYDCALAIQPDNLNMLAQRGIVLQVLNRFTDAIQNCERALALKPDMDFMFGSLLSLKMKQCDWHDFDNNLRTLTEKITAGEKAFTPFFVHSMSASTAVQQQAAHIYALAKYPSTSRLPPIVKHSHTKIKIAYFSADFREHPVAYLIAELLERHDRERFEVIAFSFNANSHNSNTRLRLEAACDRFIDVSQQSDEQVVQLARQMEIDIAIDLNGFTDGCRTDIFALRAAPIQVGYLGYLGTMGTDYMDYLLADSTLIPPEHQAHYNEKIAYLPHSFQVNDSKLSIAQHTFTRAECGLPAQGFVFCCFNNNYKITPTVFDSWMRILQQVDGSVLWLLEDNDAVISNLRGEATVRGVNAERVVFAKRLPMPEYLARHRVADLFLDTQPYNAGATASGALWSGLPVLTCLGSTFAGRMAASLLNAIGLPELITTNLADYEALAIQLATHPEQLAAIKQTLADNRLTQPLFDTKLFTHHLESAYQAMFARYQADLVPEHIYVQAQESVMQSAAEPSTDNAQQFQHAMRLHQQNQLIEAEALYEDILRTQPQHIDALHFLGVLKNQQGQTQRAVELITQSLALYPDNAAARSNLALALQSLHRLDDALACYDKVLALTPDNIDALLIRGNLLLSLNRPVDALNSYDTLLALQPNSIDLLSGRGIALQMLNRFDEALLDYDRILAIDPHHAEALFGRANVLYKLKRLDDALISYERSLAINPDSAEALYNQGLLLAELNRIDDAISNYQRTLAIKPDYAEVHNNLGSLLKKQERYTEAASSYQRAIVSKPTYTEAYCNLITLLKDQGRTNDAQATINAALAAIPDSLELRFIQLIMSLPMVTHSVTEAALVPAQFDTALTDLENWLTQSPSHQHSLATAGLLPLPFLLAYRTGNHVQRLARYGDIVAVQSNAVAVDKTRTKLKMVVVSHHFHRHSVWDVITRGLLVNIDRNRFELVLYHLGGLEDQETAFAKSLADVWRDTQTFTDVNGWLSALADDKPDVIFYPEIGMDPMSARLAAHRLAPLQIASWGHPVTTGLPDIDLYFSGDLLEAPDADSHYRERLIRLPSTGCCTTLFNVTPEPLSELAAQLTTRQGISFIIPQTVYKFDPADDGLYADIASVVGNCTFILLRGGDNAWAMDQVVKRLEQTFIDRGLHPDQHLLVIPWQSVEKFQTLLDLCDVYLDCPSFSGYTTAWQAAHRGIPILTLEGEFMRQRLAAGLLRKIGITDTIAQSREEYVQLAAQLADECRNPIARNARRQQLKTAAPKADNDVSVVRAFEQTVIKVLAEKVL